MTSQRRDLGLQAAVTRLPAHAADIESLFHQNPVFHGICDDLATMEEALLGVDEKAGSQRDAIRAEYQNLIDELTAEIEAELLKAKVISIAEAKRHHDH